MNKDWQILDQNDMDYLLEVWSFLEAMTRVHSDNIQQHDSSTGRKMLAL